MNPDIKTWTQIGQTENASFYEVESQIIAVVPIEGSTDNEITAEASIETQLAYLRSKNKPAGVIVFMDPIAEQTAGARAVYREKPDQELQKCFALVGGSFFGRAVGSVFLGLSKPLVPTQMFGSFEQALDWCRSKVVE